MSDKELDDFDRLLQDFIDSELKDVETNEDTAPQPTVAKQSFATKLNLAPEEKTLFGAWKNFVDGIYKMVELYQQTTMPKFLVEEDDLFPRYKPFAIENFTHDTLLGWAIMLETYPNQIGSIKPNSSDEQILDVAEKTSDEVLQNVLISYVEILIELEACDIAYQTRLAKARKKVIAQKIYEEHNRRRGKIEKYIKKLEEKKFPINAKNLILNYFKVAKKDPDGAWLAITTNPAMFSPIETKKIPSSFFGLIKPKPEDGFKWNKKIGNFIKNLNV